MPNNNYTLGKKYSIIAADCPWQYRVWSKKGEGRTAESHYPTMTIKDIQNLDISKIAAKDCALFMWVTAPCLDQGIETLKKWGFDFKTVAFTWVKRNKKAPSWFWGMGFYTRSNAEYVLLGTRGKPSRINAGIHSVLDDAVMEHSRKPDTYLERIEQLMGDLPRVELFARRRRDGWDAIGNEIDGKDIRDVLKEW